jgi:hypothetical protein
MTDAQVSPDARVRIPPNVYARAFGEEVVLLDFKRGEYFGLDAIGAEVWRGIEANETLASIAKRIVQRYEVSEEQALRDVTALVSQMTTERLVEVA